MLENIYKTETRKLSGTLKMRGKRIHFEKASG